MALLPRIKVCSNSTCTSFTVEDVTGLYDATTNTGGWGTPNIDAADVDTATLTITTPDGVTQTAINVLASMPSSNLAYFDIKEVTADLIGGVAGAKLADGLYKIVYRVVDTGTGLDVSQTIEHYIHCTTTACVQGLFANLEVCDCSCDTDAVEKAIYAFGLHEALRAAVQCSKLGRVTDIQAALTKICNNTNC